MKKYLLLASVAALAFTSCSDQSTEFVGDSAIAKQSREITFAPISKPTTRAIVPGTDYPTTASFFVSAYSIPVTGTAGEYFSNITFSQDGTNLWWVGSPKQYWPLSASTLNFLGISGVPNANISSTWTSAGATITWTHNGSLTDATGMYDLMYAVGQGAVTVDGTNPNKLNYGNNVNMVFKHALAQIEFNTAVGSSDYAANIHIDKIVLNGMVTGGTFALTNADPTETTAQSASGVWTSTANADTDVPGSNAFASTNMTTSPQFNGAVIVPCKDDATTFNSFSGFTVHFTMNGNQYTYNYTPSAGEKVLTQGKKYVYNITLSLTQIQIAPSVTDWNTDINGDSTPGDVIVVAIPGA